MNSVLGSYHTLLIIAWFLNSVLLEGMEDSFATVGNKTVSILQHLQRCP
jgi:hypothetical protein